MKDCNPDRQFAGVKYFIYFAKFYAAADEQEIRRRLPHAAEYVTELFNGFHTKLQKPLQ